MVAFSLTPLFAVSGILISSAAAAPKFETPNVVTVHSRKLPPGAWCLSLVESLDSTNYAVLVYSTKTSQPELCHKIEKIDTEKTKNMDLWSITLGGGMTCKMSPKSDCSCPKPEDCADIKGELTIMDFKNKPVGKTPKGDWVKSLKCSKI